MPAITVRNISSEAHEALKQRARLRGTSAEAEVRAMIEEAAFPKGEGFGTKLHNIFRKSGVTLPEIKRDQRPSEPAIFE
ncbi:FitA-like ribbon-helix-helix domain-containing protein [Granulicella paludicola]|jgi:plasmid stability protein|uniref:FitA-like ribbon-helix-helix domain-containing protein n=1 Tax=Granulicella paludicola TaxID=474951 RepID=UPI0021DF9ACA|nr:plasmid stability protein [Granulicella paludicola]